MKSTVEEIRARFDVDVDRFSQLETGQQAMPDSPLCLRLVTEAAAAITPHARAVLDLGCGAGNYTLKLMAAYGRPLAATLVDLSQPMLTRAEQRLRAAGATEVTPLQGDVRDVDLGEGQYDVVLAAAVLHHLRTDAEWDAVFAKIRRSLRPGGCFWIVDIVEQARPETQALTWRDYGEYLVELGGPSTRDKVFAYVEAEDTPRPLTWQLEHLARAGFTDLDVLHKRLCAAAFGGLAR